MKKLLAILAIVIMFLVSCGNDSIKIKEGCYQGTVYLIGGKGYLGFMAPKFVNNKTVKCTIETFETKENRLTRIK